MKYSGSCHCGNISIALETDQAPDAMTVRACQCSFCRKHNTRAVVAPQGHLTIWCSDTSRLNRYTFGLETAEYLICKTCGVYVAAVTRSNPQRGLVIVNALDDHALFSRDPAPSVYDHESEPERILRRRKTWTPVTFSM